MIRFFFSCVSELEKNYYLYWILNADNNRLSRVILNNNDVLFNFF